jgi:hypothetical protein
MLRRTVIVGAISSLAFLPMSVSAAFKTPWDGEWRGTTEKGAPLDVTISGSAVTAYQFQGQSVVVNSSQVTPTTVVFHVGQLNGEIRLIRAGETSANFTYSASDGGHAHGKLVRK